MDNLLCRGCLKAQGQKSFSDEFNGATLANQFFECTGINVDPDKDTRIPDKLCNTCFKKLREFHSFRILCNQSDAVIKKHFNEKLLSEDIKCTKGLTDFCKRDKNIQELHFLDDFQFVYKPKQKKKNRLTKHMCEVCGYRANDAYTLSLHSNTHIKNIERIHACHLCNKKFSTSISLKSHISRHSISNSVMCEECGCKFSAVAHLRTHKKSYHSNLRPYSCDLCPKTFTLRSNLTVHQKIHAGIKPHKCQTCGKAFTTTSDLKGHMRSHSGEKPHVCSVCNKAFSLRSNLNVHLRIHSQSSTSLKCSQCDRTFTSKASLKSHQKTHSGVRLHVCNICSAQFTHSNTLRTHHTVHTGRRDHACTQCDKKFSRASILKSHMKKHNIKSLNKDIPATEDKKHSSNVTISSKSDTRKYESSTSHTFTSSTLSSFCEEHQLSNKENKNNGDLVSIVGRNPSSKTRNASVIEITNKPNHCACSNKEKAVVAEQMCSVHVGTTLSSCFSCIPILAASQPVVQVQPTRIQSANVYRTQTNILNVETTVSENNTQIFLQSGIVPNASLHPNVTVIRSNNIVPTTSRATSTVKPFVATGNSSTNLSDNETPLHTSV